MRLPFSGWSRRALARLGIVLALLLFVAINLFAGGALNRLRFDLTEDGRFTLSPATERLAARSPADALLVTESGIGGPEDVARLAASGASAMLVGESLMRQVDVTAATRALLST